MQIVILGDAKTYEPVSYEVHIIQESEAKSTERQLTKLLDDKVSVVAAGGDGAMDSKPLYDFCENCGIAPIFKPDINARTDTDSERRNKVVTERNRLGYKGWAKKNRYGFR